MIILILIGLSAVFLLGGTCGYLLAGSLLSHSTNLTCPGDEADTAYSGRRHHE